MCLSLRALKGGKGGKFQSSARTRFNDIYLECFSCSHGEDGAMSTWEFHFLLAVRLTVTCSHTLTKCGAFGSSESSPQVCLDLSTCYTREFDELHMVAEVLIRYVHIGQVGWI
jgi:hypothetical protein